MLLRYNDLALIVTTKCVLNMCTFCHTIVKDGTNLHVILFIDFDS